MPIKSSLPGRGIEEADIKRMEAQLLKNGMRYTADYPDSTTLRPGDVAGDFSFSSDGNTVAICTQARWIFLP
jgi:hypothetical protein